MSVTKRAESRMTLTTATYAGRELIKFTATALVVLIFGRMLLVAAVAYWKATHPEPPPPPTVGFGKLPKLEFPIVPEEDRPLSYTLELPNGSFADFGDRAKVFLMPKKAANLLSDQKAKEIAARYDFVFEPQRLDLRTYRWTKSQPLEMSLEIDTQDFTFELQSNYLSRPDLLLNNTLPEDYEAVARVKSMLQVADLLPNDLATSSGKVTYLKSIGGELKNAVSLSDADFLRVDLNRTPIDNQFYMYSPDGEKGVVSAIISGAVQNYSGIVELGYHHRSADYDQVETYPIRTPQMAWKVLSAGEGHVAQRGTLENAVIRSVSMGYYDSWEEQEFLQPIYIFEGDGGFIGYVSAVDPRYILVDSE